MKQCLSDISSDKMAISIRGFAGFWPLWVSGLSEGDIFHRGVLDGMRGTHLQKRDKSVFSFQKFLLELDKQFALLDS